MGGHRSDARWTGAGADEQNPRVKVRAVSFRMTLVPSPIAKNALVNEGEGVRFVSHAGYDAGTGGMLTLRKYSVRPESRYRFGVGSYCASAIFRVSLVSLSG